MYTNDCQINSDILKLLKFADDSSIIALLRSPEDETVYTNYIHDFTKWCVDHNLLLNVSKTKELVIDFRKNKEPINPIKISDQNVTQVESYKYLGVTIDNQLKWDEHASITFKKANKRVYFLRKLKQFQIDSTLIYLFYQSTIQSILSFCVTGWGGNVSETQKNKVDSLIKRSSKLFSNSPMFFDDLFELGCARKILSIDKDSSHPLNYNINRSIRSGRIQLLLAKTMRYKNSFIPHSIKFLQNGR